MSTTNAPYDLERFVQAQESIYSQALSELKNGHKRSHWMWFIFPQIDGLGSSQTARRYAIKSVQEARAYLDHPVLGDRLVECADTVARINGRTVSQIFGFPDDIKLRSSMTLFEHISEPDSVFTEVLNKFFNGNRDERTLEILAAGAE